jgi:hypothetical protein
LTVACGRPCRSTPPSPVLFTAAMVSLIISTFLARYL